jgi:NTE family protein
MTSRTRPAPIAPRPGRAPAARRRARTGAAHPPIQIDLALQGGGSHGAFTWGVLDRLLEDETLSFSAVSGTSAGALNAAVLATGWARGGRVAARAALAAFWQAIGQSNSCFGAPVSSLPGWPPGLALPGAPGLAGYNLDWNPAYLWFNQFLRLFSPYQFNAFGDNPLRKVLADHVEPEALKRGELPLFITATAVRTGQPRVFDHRDLSIDALLASCCLPHLFKAVPLPSADGRRTEPYWDGGFSGNPALWPLIDHAGSLDLLLVRINPLVRADLPDTPAEIADRTAEIGFNTALLGELRTIALVQKLVAQDRLDPRAYRGLRVHTIADDKSLSTLSTSSKMNTDPRFLQALHTLGRAAADAWWHAHRADLGVQQARSIHETYLSPRG